MPETPHILVIDDDIVYAEVLGRSLQRRGMQALVANNLSQAMELAAQYLPHYVVLDLKLEQESGLEAIAPLLAINADMKILVLTGYSSIATAVSAIKQGALDYAPKPLDADAVLHKLGIGGSNTAIVTVPEQPPSVDRMEWEHIQRVLAEHDNNISATARSLGMHRRTLQRKLQKRPVRN
ncbi:MAG TPA: response regulator transcription factor [Pseudomonadaceae bacterium]|nr:response regulator transcription factor [Pseudomonadaceae bacterium]